MNKINQHMYVEFTFDVEVEDGVGDGVVEDVVDVGGVEAWKISGNFRWVSKEDQQVNE